MARLKSPDTIFLNLDYEYTKDLHEVLCKLEDIDHKHEILSLDDYGILSDLRTTICSKITNG